MSDKAEQLPQETPRPAGAEERPTSSQYGGASYSELESSQSIDSELLSKTKSLRACSISALVIACLGIASIGPMRVFFFAGASLITPLGWLSVWSIGRDYRFLGAVLPDDVRRKIRRSLILASIMLALGTILITLAIIMVIAGVAPSWSWQRIKGLF